jgi:pyruvate dehydrogenase E1 component alpha subunit
MKLSRAFDDRLIEIYGIGKTPIFMFSGGPLPGELHSSNGQEPVGAGVCAALSPDDMITADHRPHHIAVARGVDLARMAAELQGKKSGLSGGRGGHMHIYDSAVNFSASAIIAEGLAPAAGMALARRMQGRPGVGVGFIGDGAANQGAVHEILNLAALHKLPFIMVIQDNKWAVTTHKSTSTSIERNSDRAASYGIVGEFVAGNDVEKIYEAACRAVARARAGEGPTLLEIETVRLTGHFAGDPGAYLSPEQRKYQVDCIPLYRHMLIESGVLTAEAAERIDADVAAQIDDAFAEAASSPYPDPAEAMNCVFA